MPYMQVWTTGATVTADAATSGFDQLIVTWQHAKRVYRFLRVVRSRISSVFSLNEFHDPAFLQLWQTK